MNPMNLMEGINTTNGERMNPTEWFQKTKMHQEVLPSSGLNLLSEETLKTTPTGKVEKLSLPGVEAAARTFNGIIHDALPLIRQRRRAQ